MKSLPCEIVATLPLDSEWDSVRIDERRSGIRIDLQDVTFEEGMLSFGLRVGYKLPFQFATAFANVHQAFVLFIEVPDLPGIGHALLADPQSVLASPNFDGEPRDDASASTFMGGRLGRIMVVNLPPSLPRCRIFLRACVQDLFSNVLSVDLPSLAINQHE